MFSGSVDADFVLALLFHHRDLEADCVGVSTNGEGGFYAQAKNTSARLCAKNAGGGGIFAGHYGIPGTIADTFFKMEIHLRTEYKLSAL